MWSYCCCRRGKKPGCKHYTQEKRNRETAGRIIIPLTRIIVLLISLVEEGGESCVLIKAGPVLPVPDCQLDWTLGGKVCLAASSGPATKVWYRQRQ